MNKTQFARKRHRDRFKKNGNKHCLNKKPKKQFSKSHTVRKQRIEEDMRQQEFIKK